MIDVMENKIPGPAILKGLEQGRQEGRHEGKKGLLHDQLSSKFGSLPDWAEKRLTSASDTDIDKWARRILVSDSLEDTLR